MNKLILVFTFLATFAFFTWGQTAQPPRPPNKEAIANLTQEDLAEIRLTFEYLLFLTKIHQQIWGSIRRKQFEFALIKSFEGYTKEEIEGILPIKHTLQDLDFPSYGACDIVFGTGMGQRTITCDFIDLGQVSLVYQKSGWECINNSPFIFKELSCLDAVKTKSSQ